jgi:hypothetical protein
VADGHDVEGPASRRPGGEPIDERDDAGGAAVVVIDEALARRHWPGGDPIGEHILMTTPEGRGRAMSRSSAWWRA